LPAVRAKPINAILTGVTQQLFRAARAGVHNVLKRIQIEDEIAITRENNTF